MHVPPESYALRTRKPRVNPHRRLNRKSWVDSSFAAVENLCGLQNVAENAENGQLVGLKPHAETCSKRLEGTKHCWWPLMALLTLQTIELVGDLQHI